jgi:putative oxidoreductase
VSANPLKAAPLPWVKADLAPLVLRLGLAAIFVTHGVLKVMTQGGRGWWDPQQLAPTLQAVVAWGELAAGVALLVGFLSRLAALGLIVDMVGAVILVAGKKGFVPVQAPGQPGLNFLSIGYEYNVAIIVSCLALIFLGSGGLSVDSLLWRRKQPS